MSALGSADRDNPFADELLLLAPELAGAFDAALAELLAASADAPASDDRLAGLLATGEGTGAEVIMLSSARRRRTARRLAVTGGATVVVVAATTGLAAASVLPPPVQRAVAAAAAKVGLDLPQPTQRVVASPPTTVAQPDLAPLVVSLPPLNPPGTEPTPTTAAPAQPTAAVPEAAPQAPPDPAAGAAAVKDPPPAATPATPSPATPARPEATPPPTPAPVLPTVPPVVQPPAPPGIAAFRQAVVAYVMCLRAADGDPVKVGACVFPNPADFGLSGWPWDIPRPSRDQP